MIRALLLLAVALAPVPAASQGLSAAEFEALTEGRTLHFTLDGRPYGAEQFFAGRRSLWQYADGTCIAGVWRERDGLICFTYEDTPGEQCWRLRRGPAAGLAAEFIAGGAASGLTVRMSRKDVAPLPCPGPDVGS